ncbi:hypothetical protein [Cohnella sp. AR92]|uniref:hypothetical protein n=1 Tax=Cohnella sp. AR92 TaxID=648716 RepID=UPI000F8EF21A|nr:hypothetical protein [Cohnella sp. AR92]RUS48519.1 hypothetical protein ELR57_03655 [Cohnella sp. AR92]
MSKDLIKLLVVAGAILFAVMFGMELASSGIHEVYGPLDNGGSAVSGTVRDDPESGRYGNEPRGISYEESKDDAKKADAGQEGTEAAIPRLDHTPMVDQLAGKTADALQSVSRGGIHFLVNLFSKTTE